MKSKIERPYEMDKYFQKWLVGLSERTKKNYRNRFQPWFDFIGMSPTEQIEKRLKDTASGNMEERTFFENKFRAYKEHLEKRDLTPEGVRTLLTPVASFFSRNGLPLNLKRGDWESTQTQQVVHRMKLTKEDVKSMYSHGNTRDRALLLVLAQSGFSEADVSCLKIEQLKGLYENPETEHYFIEKPREKTGEMQATCFSYEAMHDIKAMLQERDNPSEGFLFVSTTKGIGSQLEVRSISTAIKNLAIKAFGAEKAKEFKTKMLRSFYNSALLRAGIQPQEVKDLMFGHGRKGARGHYDYDEFTIREAYKQAFEYLSINGLQTRTDIAKLKEDFTKTKSEFFDMLATEKAKSNKLEKQVAEMQSGIDFLKKYIGLTDVVETQEDAQELLDALENLRKKKMAREDKFPEAR
jgi:site-specific recombinase XerD